MALPGGRTEAADGDLLTTAIRETHEEIGLRLDRTHLLGTLDDVVPRTPVLPPIAVRPYVFLLPARPDLTPNAEVAATTWVPLDHLLRPGTFRRISLQILGSSREVNGYTVQDSVVWGMTERIITNLLGQLTDPTQDFGIPPG
jgi:8-oxo-dGTP pyrophosphatase MutT (NUDIX family)